ncbi:MAG: hypothetical protein ACFN20_05090 [Bacteroidota bacterium]
MIEIYGLQLVPKRYVSVPQINGYAPTPRLAKDGKGYPQYHNALDKLQNIYGLSRGTLPLQIASENDKYRNKKTNLFPYKY